MTDRADTDKSRPKGNIGQLENKASTSILMNTPTSSENIGQLENKASTSILMNTPTSSENIGQLENKASTSPQDGA